MADYITDSESEDDSTMKRRRYKNRKHRVAKFITTDFSLPPPNSVSLPPPQIHDFAQNQTDCIPQSAPFVPNFLQYQQIPPQYELNIQLPQYQHIEQPPQPFDICSRGSFPAIITDGTGVNVKYH